MDKVAIVTGISGQDGSYLAKLLVEKDYKVVGLVRDLSLFNDSKLKSLSISKRVDIHEVSLLDYSGLLSLFLQYKPSKIFNFAAQSSASLSYTKPRETIEFNVQSVMNLLDCIVSSDPKAKFFQASSSEIFGNPKTLPVNEKTLIEPINPYAISKATGHNIIRFYRDYFNLSIATGIFLNHESVLRSENFVVKKIIRNAMKIKYGNLKVLAVGNIKTRRDFGYAPSYMELVYKIMTEECGDDYIVSTGVSTSIEEIVYYVLDKLKINHSVIQIDPSLFRENDNADLYGDSSKAFRKFGWKCGLDFFDVLDEMMEYENKKYQNL